MAQFLDPPTAISMPVRPGAAIAFEGFTHPIPHAAAHEVIRQGVGDLTPIRMTPDVVYGQMIGMGLATKLIFAYAGNPGLGLLRRLCDAVEHHWPIPLAALAEGLDVQAIDEVIFGCANQAGEDDRDVARMSSLLTGLPEAVPGPTMNRLCGSGMDAVITAARAIRAGEADLILAGGAESMSRAPFVMPKAPQAFTRANEVHDTTIGWRFIDPLMKAQYGVGRADQDAFALRSQDKAAAARANGRLAQKVTPVSMPQRKGDPVAVTQDEQPRQTALAKLGFLPTPFRGAVTAGNVSGVNDGAAAPVMASEAGMTCHGLTPIARVLGGATAGVPPRIMGIGPAPATQKLRALGSADDDPRVIPNGGAIALGHPLGMSGARITGTDALERTHTRPKAARHHVYRRGAGHRHRIGKGLIQ